MNKHTSGLVLLDATRLSLSNYNPDLHAITVNGLQLSYRDIELASIKITDNKAYVLDDSDGKYYEIIHTNSDIEIKFEEETSAKVQTGQIIPAGDALFKQQSPAPFCYIDKTGRLASSNLWTSVWEANQMGFVDVDKGLNTYKHGLCPEGSDIHENLFLRKDGVWGSPSTFTGSVSETFLSLNDTPTTYTSNLDKYLRVSYEEGGSIVFDAIDTSKVPENNNLYYTIERVDERMTTQLQNKSIANISISGQISCNELLTDSDERLKTNIEPLCADYCLQLVDDLKPCEYQFKDDSKTRYGLIAQEVETSIPNLVNNDRSTKSINYIDLIPILIGSIKDLKEQVDCLKFDLEIANNKISHIE